MTGREHSIIQNRKKKLLLSVAFVPFLLLYLQQLTGLPALRSLKGDFVPAVRTELSADSWFSGQFQEQENLWLNDNFGFRNFFVRLHNQLAFTFYKKTTAREVVIGKNNVLYTQGYIDGYYGLDFIGESAIRDTVAIIKKLQDTLQSFGKKLLVVLAPGKARIYPEHLPEPWTKAPEGHSNYKLFSAAFREAGVQVIDFNQHFLNKKRSEPYDLIPQLGIHWSRLEAVKAADSILSRFSFLSGQTLPRIHISRLHATSTLEEVDRDVAEPMNLLFLPSHKAMAYPEFEMRNEDDASKSLMVIGDSFWWDIYLQNIPKRAFKVNQFWYYFKEYWSSYHISKKDAAAEDLKRRILQSDYVLLICAESNMGRLGFGFPGAAMSALRHNIQPSARELEKIKTEMKLNAEWMTQIRTKSKALGVSEEEMLERDAKWYFQNHGPLPEVRREDVIAAIRNVPEWMSDIERKARERNISVDSMIGIDADWYITVSLEDMQPKKLRLKNVISQISSDARWMEQIKEKAKQRNISVDSMKVLDALWYIEQSRK